MLNAKKAHALFDYLKARFGLHDAFGLEIREIKALAQKADGQS